MCSLQSVNEAAADDLASEVEVDVALIEQHIDAVLVRQPNDRLEILRSHNRARRIRRRIQNDRLGLRRNRRLNHLRGDAEVLFLFALDQHNLAARVLDDVLERHPVGHRQDDLVAMIDQHLDRVEERQLAASREHALVRRVVRPEVAGMAIDNRLTHLGNAGHVRVAGEVLLDRLDGRVLDVPRGREVRLARTEVRQVHALGLQLQRRRGNRHGCRNFDAADTVRKYLRRSCCCHISSLADLASEIKPSDSERRLTPIRHLSLQPFDDQRRNQRRDVATELKDSLDQPRTDVGVLLGRHHEQSFELRIELPVHHRHLKLIFVVADGPNASQNRLGPLLPGKVDQKSIKGGHRDVPEAASRLKDHLFALRNGK